MNMASHMTHASDALKSTGQELNIEGKASAFALVQDRVL